MNQQHPLLPLVLLLASALTMSACQGGDTAPDPANADYLQHNAAAAGVVTLPSGLQYKVLQQGHGKTPSATDTVVVHYRGQLLDGSEFDSSYERGEPARFPVNRVIPGWTEALQLMKEGAKWQLTIPPDLGYGSRGVRGAIPADAVLLFDVELLKVE